MGTEATSVVKTPELRMAATFCRSLAQKDDEIAELRKQRDALREACEAAKEFYYHGSGEAKAVATRAAQIQGQIDAALAVAEGKQ